MIQLEIEIMFISIRSKPYFLYDNFCSFRLDFLLFLLLLINKLLVISNLANWWICIW